MKRKVFAYVFCALLCAQALTQEVLLTVHDQNVTAEEFMRVYNKNRNVSAVDTTTIEQSLEMFINFKLKVIEAESLGYDTLKVFKDEFESYRKQLVKPYLIDKTVEEKLIQQVYDRIANEVNVSHIVVSVNKSASPADTLKAFNKITSIYHRVVSNGEDFNEVAKSTSDDPSAKTNEGKLGFFKAFNMVYSFENVAYATKVGEVSKPFRTGFGYHILKVHESRPSPGEIKVAHIMKSYPNGVKQHQRDSLKKEIDKIYAMLQNGGDFAEISKNYSDDRHSAAKGGELPWFATGKMIASFADVSFALNDIGDISQPMETRYGWHIIKKLDWKGIPEFEEMKDELTEKVKRDVSRTKLSEEVVVNRLKKDYAFQKNQKNLEKTSALLSEGVFKGKWVRPANIPNVIIATFAGQDLKLADFVEYILENQKKTSVKSKDLYVDQMFEKFSREAILAYEETQLDKKYPEYKHLVQEYHDAILLFNLTDELVWSKSISDTTGLQNYFDNHRDQYMWGQRIRAKIYSSKNGKTIGSLRKQLKKKALTDDEILAEYCDSTMQLCIRIKDGVFEKDGSEILEGTKLKLGVSKVIKNEDNYYVLLTDEVLAPVKKELMETKGFVTADYQKELEHNWIEVLRKKYKVEIKQEVLAKLLDAQDEN